jgi:hypothetical protein
VTQHDAFDHHLPMLTTSQAERLRQLVADDFLTRHGVRPTITGDVVEYDRRRNPLTGLAQRCRTVAEQHWPELVAWHFTRLEGASRGGEGADELLRQTFLRLVTSDAFPEDAAGHFREVATRTPKDFLNLVTGNGAGSSRRETRVVI